MSDVQVEIHDSTDNSLCVNPKPEFLKWICPPSILITAAVYYQVWGYHISFLSPMIFKLFYINLMVTLCLA